MLGAGRGGFRSHLTPSGVYRAAARKESCGALEMWGNALEEMLPFAKEFQQTLDAILGGRGPAASSLVPTGSKAPTPASEHSGVGRSCSPQPL